MFADELRKISCGDEEPNLMISHIMGNCLLRAKDGFSNYEFTVKRYLEELDSSLIFPDDIDLFCRENGLKVSHEISGGYWDRSVISWKK